MSKACHNPYLFTPAMGTAAQSHTWIDSLATGTAARWRWRILAAALCLLFISFQAPRAALAEPTAESYVEQVGGGATIVAPGELLIANRRMQCGNRPTVIDPNLDDFGAAYPGFIILNPKKLANVPPAVALWIYAHECGHQMRGPDEDTADCFAVQRGRRMGWLDATGVEEICTFITPAQGDSMHFAGPMRCRSVRRCFGEKTVY